MQTSFTLQELIFETTAVCSAQAMQLDEAALSQALVSLATGMEQIEHTLYKLMVRR